MNDVVPQPQPQSQPQSQPQPQPVGPSSERSNLTLLTHIMYGLHLASFFSAGVFSVIALILNYVKRPDLPDDFFRSHFRWQSRSFWFTLMWLVLSSPLFLLLVFPGVAAWCVIGLWYLYRFIRGWLAFSEGRAMPVPMP